VNQQHISDEDLRLIVAQQDTDTPNRFVESHVSSCQHCQDRLLQVAADETWRQECVSSLQELPSYSAVGQATAQMWGSPGSLASNSRSGDAFDLQTVDQMLGQVLQAPSHPEMLGKLGRYDVEGVIGCGGMGVVLRAFDQDLHRPVAIKLILPRLATNGTAKQRFAREARAAAAVLHPNVISIHGIDETAGVPWFVMPLVPGPSLGDLVQEKGPLPEREIVRIGMQIASGLAAAHCQGLVHRDIKPENILVDNQVNRVVITDFGLAQRDSDDSMTRTGWLAGTLNYMSPEQSRGEEVDARSDLFSLGGLLYYLATGALPFKASSAMGVLHKIGNQDPANVQDLNPEISSTLSQVIHRLLMRKAEDRFQSAVEVEAFLTEFLSHLHQPTKFDLPTLPGQHAGHRSLQNDAGNFLSRSTAVKRLTTWTTLLLTLLLVTLPYWGHASWFPVPNGFPAANGFPAGGAPAQPMGVPPVTPPALTLLEISQKYQIDSVDDFQTQLRQLQDDFSATEEAFGQSVKVWGTESLNQDIVDYQDQMQVLDQQLQ